jgi:hypothetical protein
VLTRKISVLSGETIVLLLELSNHDLQTGQLSIEAAVFSVSVLQLSSQLIIAASKVSIGVLGLLETLGEIVNVGLGLKSTIRTKALELPLILK